METVEAGVITVLGMGAVIAANLLFKGHVSTSVEVLTTFANEPAAAVVCLSGPTRALRRMREEQLIRQQLPPGELPYSGRRQVA